MKKLNLSAVTTTIGFPQKSGSLNHIQSAYQEAIASAVRAIIFGTDYDPTIAYVLHGCEATGSDPGARTIAAGAIFFNGEVYQVPAASFTTTGLQVAVGTITTTFFADATADPVQFTDGVNRNVHEIRQIVFAAGLSGSGDFNFSNVVDLRYKPQGCIGQVIMWKIPSGVYSDYFDGTGLGIHRYTDGWAVANGNNGTQNFAGRVPVGLDTGDTDFDTVGETGGAKTHTLLAAEIPTNLTLTIPTFSETGTGAVASGGASPDGNVSVNVTNTGGSQPHNNLQPYRVALMIERIS